jgi:hypothetical protein
MPAPLLTRSQAQINRQAAQFGTVDYENWQALRGPFYSLVNYPLAGSNSINLFGASLGTVNNEQLTNMPDSNSFGIVNLQVKAIRCARFLAVENVNGFTGTDASTFYSEHIDGIFQSGVLRFKVGDRTQLTLPLPFLYAPPADGRAHVYSAGLTNLVLAEAQPNTLVSTVSAPPHAELLSRKGSAFVLDRNKFIAALQNFSVELAWPSGPVAVTATGIVNAQDNPLFVGLVFDGVIFKPMQ